MDLYVLDRSLTAIKLVDVYSSMIWTDRYYEAGDFELCMAMDQTLLDYIKQDYYLWRRDSEHTMIIEKLQIATDAEEGNTITVTGRSLESILERRIIWGLKTLSGNFQEAIKSLLYECIIEPAKAERKIENFIFEESDDPRITSLTIETQYTGDNLYNVVSSLCSERGVGFKVTINAAGQFVFKLYAGTDRSYSQFANPYVIFSPNFDNIVSSNYLETRESLKNVTLVGGEGEGSERRYTAVGDTSGLDRRELFTDARDISSDADEELTELFTFTQYPSQVFNVNSKTFVTDANFRSCMVDISAYVGCKLSISIPRYTKTTGGAAGYATILVNSSKQYISTLKIWEDDGEPGGTEESPKARGSLETYEIQIPSDATYIYTSMFSQTAIDNDIYSGDLDDFECQVVQISNDQYIAMLRQRGKEDLAENVEVVSFEGEAETTTMFKYGSDFFVGDIVQVSDEYGHDVQARVLELVMSDNEDGTSTAYPTFSTFAYEPPEPNLLPDGYTKLDYIYSSGTQYIDTGFKPNQDTRVLADVYLLSESSYPVAIFGTRDSATSKAFVVWGMKADEFRTDYGSNAGRILVPPVGRHTIDKNRNATYVDETLVTQNTETFQATNNLLLFTQQDSTVDTRMVSMRLYSCKIYDNGTLIRNYIPCLDPEGEIGLYDSVGELFYENAGTRMFGTPTTNPGGLPDGYTELNYIQSSGTQYINTGFKPNQDTRVVMDIQALTAGTIAFFGSRSDATSNTYTMWMISESQVRSDYNAEQDNITISALNRLTIDKNKNNTTVNGIAVSASYAAFSAPDNLVLLTQSTAGSVDSKKMSARLYSCQVYDNGILVRDFIPAKNSNNVVGLYELVGQTFYTNSGTGTFMAG